MGVDWEFLKSSAGDVDKWTKEDMEDVYQNICGISKLRSRDRTVDKLELIFNLSQIILVAKWNQVSALEDEIKNLADSAGRMDALREQELLEEIDRLNHMLETGPPPSKTIKIDESSFPYDWSREWKAKKQELEEKLIQKNNEIEQLIENLSGNESEKNRLENEVTNLQSRLSLATSEMNSMAADTQAIKRKLAASDEKVSSLEAKIASLEVRNDELKHIKRDQENKYSEFQSEVDDRVEKLADVIKEKDLEIFNLKKEVRKFENYGILHDREQSSKDESEDAIHQMKQVLEKREEEIKLLTDNLSKATKEIDKDAELIATLKRSRRSIEMAESEEISKLRSELHEQANHIKRLENQLLAAEDDAQILAQDLSTCLSELKAYFRGEYSLADAVADLKETRKQLRLRDSEIQELTFLTNQFQINLNSLLDENMELREQLNLEPRDNVNLPGIKTTDWKNSKQIIEKMTSQIYKLQEEKNSFRATIFDMTRHISDLKHALQRASSEKTDVGDAVPNESIRDQISQLHMAVMRLTQLQQTDNGSCEEVNLLKEKCLRLEGEKFALEKALRADEEDEDKFPAIQDLNALELSTLNSRRNLKKLKKALKGLPLSAEESLARLKTQVKFLLEETNKKDSKIEEGKSHLSTYKSQFESLFSEVTQLNDKMLSEGQKWEEIVGGLRESESSLASKKVALESQVTELKIYIEECKANPDEAANKLALRNAENKYENELSKRMIEVHRKEIDLLRERLVGAMVNRMRSCKKIKEIQNELILTTDRHSQLVSKLKLRLARSVSSSSYNAIHTDLAIMTTKYRATLNNQLLKNGERIERNILESKIEDLTKHCENLEDQLIEAKQKVSSLQTSLSMVNITNDPAAVNTKINLLSKQLAAVENREMLANQRTAHAMKMHENSQKGLSEASRRLRELEESHMRLAGLNLTLQEKEVELEHQVASYSSDKIEKLNKEVANLTNQTDEAKLEARRLEMLLGVYETQLGHYKQKCVATESELNQIRRMQEDLATLSEEKAHIAILHLELSQEKSLNFELKAELAETVRSLEKASLALSQKQHDMEEREKEIRHQNSSQKLTNERLMIIIKDLRLQFAGAVPLPEMEKVSVLIEELQHDKSSLESSLTMAKKDRREARLLLQEMKVKQETLDDVMDSLNSGLISSRVLAEWSKKLEEVRLKNVHLKERLTSMEEDETLHRNLLEAKERRCDDLQDQLANLQTLWVEQQTSWEQQLWMKQLSDTPSNAVKINSESSTRSTSFDISIYENKLKLKDKEIVFLQEKNQSLNDRLVALEVEVQRRREESLNKDSPKTPPEFHDERFNIIISGLKDRIKLSEEALNASRDSLRHTQNELQEVRIQYKSQVSNLLSEKMELERKVLDLQADLDDIPVRSTSGYKVSAQQMEIESLKGSISSLEKRLERAKLERHSLEENVTQLERDLSISKRERNEERQHLEVSFEVRNQQMNREVDRLTKQIRDLQDERDSMQREIKHMQDGAIRSPSLILKTLVEKLRDQLIAKDKQISNMAKEFQQIQEKLDTAEEQDKEENGSSDHQKAERDFEDTFRKPGLSDLKPDTSGPQPDTSGMKPDSSTPIPEITIQTIEADDKKTLKLMSTVKELEENISHIEEREKVHLEKIQGLEAQLSGLKTKHRKLDKETTELKKKNKDLDEQVSDLTGRTSESIYKAMEFMKEKLLKMGEEEFLEERKKREEEIEVKARQWDDRKKFEMNFKKLREEYQEVNSSFEKEKKNLETCKELLRKSDKEKLQLRTKITKLHKAVTENLCGVCFRGLSNNDLNRTFTIEPTPVEVVHVRECAKCNSWVKDKNHLEVRLKDCTFRRKKLQLEKDDLERRLAEAMEEIAATRHQNERLKENLKALQEGKPLVARPTSAAVTGRGKGTSSRLSNIPETGTYSKFGRRPSSELAGTAVVLNYEETIANLEEEIRQKTHLLTYTKTVLENVKVREETLLKEQQKLRVKISILQSVRDDSEQAKLVAELREAKITIYRLHEELQSRSDS